MTVENERGPGVDALRAELEALQRRCTEMEHSAVEREAQLRNFMADVPCVMFRFYSRDGRFGVHFYGGRSEAIFGITPAAATAFEEFVAQVDDRDRPRFLASVMTAVQTRSPWLFEGRFRKPSGERIWFQGNAEVAEHEGEVVASGLLRDISSRKIIEERNAHLTAVLRAIRNVNQLITKERDRDRLIARVCSTLIETRSFHGAWIALRDQAGRTIAVADAGFEDISLSFLHHVRRGLLPACGRTALLQPGAVAVECTAASCRGCPLLSACSGWAGLACRLEHEGAILGTLCASVPIQYATDAEELALFEEVAGDVAFALRTLEADSARRRAQQHLTQLASGVGHELRNPLGAIKNATFFLRMALERPEAQVAETLGILELEVATAEQILGSLLIFAHPRPPHPRRSSLNAVIADVLQRCGHPEAVQLQACLDPALPMVLIDAEQVAQGLVNIVRNAIQAMPDGGKLLVTSATEPGGVAVSFADTGCGIPEAELGRIFEPLYTTKARGIGLGLAIAKTLVEGNGGTIEAQSRPGEGSTFVTRFPAPRRE
jgi:signal transduction histidine kinase